MSAPSPAIHKLARQLLDGERGSTETSISDAAHVVPVFGKLRMSLTKLAGVAGFSSLLSRALAMARRQAPSLEGVRVGADGSLEGFNQIQPDIGNENGSPDPEEVLLAEFLGLLVTLIGMTLTLSLVRQGWPDASIEIITLDIKGKP